MTLTSQPVPERVGDDLEGRKEEHHSVDGADVNRVIDTCRNEAVLILEEAEKLMMSGKYAEAREWTNLRLEQDPHDAEAHFTLGRIEREAGNTRVAFERLTKALSMNPKAGAEYYSEWLQAGLEAAIPSSELSKMLERWIREEGRRKKKVLQRLSSILEDPPLGDIARSKISDPRHQLESGAIPVDDTASLVLFGKRKRRAQRQGSGGNLEGFSQLLPNELSQLDPSTSSGSYEQRT